MLLFKRLSRSTWVLILISLIVSIAACKKDSDNTDPLAELNLPSTPYDYENIVFPDHYLTNDFPAGFPFQFAAMESDNTPLDNPTTNEGATLGRVLFYDKKLSANGTISCSSCHKQANGFSDDKVLSDGFQGGKTRRHSMGIVNARFYDTGKFFWDERAATLEDQVLMPFQDAVEMGLTLQQLEQIVQDQLYYAPLFADAFGDETINADRISKALSQFVRSIVSVNSKYDQGRVLVNNPILDFPNFTAEENLGKQLFYSQNLVAPSCNSCHMSEAFVAPLLAPNGTTIATNNGLDSVSTSDLGVFETTGINNQRGKFKVPSLKNIAQRAPFMHDGRFATLEEVIDHYSTGIQNHPTLQPFLIDSIGNPVQYNFTNQEKATLVAFLNTLTDLPLTVDDKFSNPFN
ncbi:MAG: cytochrome-c peroxidase [Bacteroidia bacterium]|nr:cytochrome-c peroxidase [Bacteroidia bacterium]NNC84617.1 cytochrome-c peroxidase [Bacteroidia bacterium]NNM16522.1 cytochrome-c peroxidase [Bacteroidia bacterium]